jgi:pentatricopeptide repeat protein
MNQESSIQYYQDIMDIFDTCRYTPPLNIWNKLLLSIYTIRTMDDHNKEKQFLAMQKCCHGLLQVSSLSSSSSSSLNSSQEQHQIIKIGLETAEAMNDPQLAASMALWALSRIDDVHLDRTHTLDGSSTVKDNKFLERHTIYLPPELILRSLKLCVFQGRVDLAEKIWLEVIDERRSLSWPKSILSDIHTMLLTGYAKVGQITKAEKLLEDMRYQGTLLR